jgi:ABC-2 type transport system permease protein
VIGAAIRKEVQLLLRDRGALVSLFVMPLVFMGVFGSMFSGDGGEEEPRLIAVHRAPRDQRAAGAVKVIADSRLFRIREEASPERVRELVADEDVVAGLVFPDRFDPFAGRPAELVIDTAGSPAVRGPIEGALAGLISRSLVGGRLPPVLVAVQPPGLQEPLAGASAFQLVVPGNAVLFGFFLALTVGISFVGERRSGTFRRLLAAPVRRPTLLFAKLVPYFLVGMTQMLLLFGFGAVVFGMAIAGSLLALALLTAALVFAAVSLGLFVGSFSGTERQVGAIGSVVLLVMGMLGGCMVPRAVMPASMREIGNFTPHAWALDGYYELLVRAGTGVADVWLEILVVAGFGAAFAIAGAARFQFER